MDADLVEAVRQQSRAAAERAVADDYDANLARFAAEVGALADQIGEALDA